MKYMTQNALWAAWMGICGVAISLVLPVSNAARAEDPCFTSAQLVKKAVNLGEGSNAEVELYQEAARLCPKMAEAPFNLGLAYQKRGELESAEREFRKAVSLKERCPPPVSSMIPLWTAIPRAFRRIKESRSSSRSNRN